MRRTSAAQRADYKPTLDDGSARAKTLAAKVATLEAKHADLNAEDEPDQAAIAKAATALARARAALAADPVAVKVAMMAASEAVSCARAELNQATAAQRVLEMVSGDKIDAWRKCIPLITAEAIHRKMCRDEAERKIAIANGTAPAPVIALANKIAELEVAHAKLLAGDDKAAIAKAATELALNRRALAVHPDTEKPAPCELERVMSARGKTKTIRGRTYFGPR
jgi:hypothetical protein